VFRGLFGSSNANSSSPPKNQIEVVCPSCGAAQFEPRLVVSTFCKRCGVHLRLEKKKVIASEVSRAGGRPDALAPAPARTPVPMNPTGPLTRGVVAGPASSTGPLLRGLTPVSPPVTALTSSLPAVEPDPETGELGLGMMLQAASLGPLVHPTAPVDAPAMLDEIVEVADEPVVMEEPPAPPSVAVVEDNTPRVATQVPMAVADLMQQSQNPPTGTLQKMREQGAYRQQYFKEAECFECSNKFKVGRSSRSANCPSCGAYISLEDVELNMPSSQSIKTRGDVLIRKRGHVCASHVYAKDLRCFGLIEANMHCSGEAIFKTSGKIIGELTCKKFTVEKGSEISFMNPIHADEMEIHGIITGNVYSRGPVIIGNGGAVNGDVTARSVSIEPGGELNGSMNIVRGSK